MSVKSNNKPEDQGTGTLDVALGIALLGSLETLSQWHEFAIRYLAPNTKV